MKKITIFLLCIVCFAACKTTVKKDAPPAPTSAAEVISGVKGKSYVVETIGLKSPFHQDSSIDWNISQEDTSAFFKNWAKEQNGFTVNFSKDSTVDFYNAFDKKQTTGIYSADNDVNFAYDDPRPGIKLRLKYNGNMGFSGDTTVSLMTISYLVKGISDKELILETGQSFNERPLVLWLKAQ